MPVANTRNIVISKTPSLRLRLRISELGQQCTLVRVWCVVGAWLVRLKFQIRRRGHTYRAIAHILAEKRDIVVASSTLVRFAATLAWKKRNYSKHPNARKPRGKVMPIVEVNVSSAAPNDDLWKRIEALKQQPAKIENSSKQFIYDPDQPLQLPHKK